MAALRNSLFPTVKTYQSFKYRRKLCIELKGDYAESFCVLLIRPNMSGSTLVIILTI